MEFDVFTLLPEVFPSYLETSIIKRARERDLIRVRVHNIRDYTHDKHHMTDDTPYGGGGGMVMKPEPIFEAVETVLGLSLQNNLATENTESAEKNLLEIKDLNIPIILLTPQGRVFDQTVAQELSSYPHLAIICGRYEGFDERIREHLVTDEISIGDYVLTGGELPALILIDAISRLLLKFSATRQARRTTLTRWVCSNIRTTPARQSSAAGKSPKFYSAARTPK